MFLFLKLPAAFSLSGGNQLLPFQHPVTGAPGPGPLRSPQPLAALSTARLPVPVLKLLWPSQVYCEEMDKKDYEKLKHTGMKGH